MVKTKTKKSSTPKPSKPSRDAKGKPGRQADSKGKRPRPADASAAKRAEAPAIVPPPPRVGDKPAKNMAGFNSRQLAHYRELLLAKRRELLGDVRSMEDEALQNGPGVGNLSNLPDHMADQGTDNYEQEFTLGLMEKDRQLLREIDAALAKIQTGTYGLCEGTGKPITKARLEAQPWARYSIEHARKLESGLRAVP